VEASRAEDLAANPLEWMASVPLPKVDDVPVNIPEWSAAVPEPTDNIEAKEPETQNRNGIGCSGNSRSQCAAAFSNS